MKNIATRLFLMSAAETTGAAAGAPTEAAPAAVESTRKKPINVTVSESAKSWIDTFKMEHHGPSISDPEKPKYLSTEEVIDVLIEVATDRRHKAVQKHDEASGEALFDGDGQPVMDSIDCLGEVAQRIISERGGNVRTASVKAQLEKAQGELDQMKSLLASLGFSDGHLPTAEELAAKLAKGKKGR